MKGKIFALLFSLIALASQSQTINGRLYTQFNNYYKWRGGAFDSVLLLPNLTATAGLRGGALRYSGSDSSLYVWSGSQWRKIGGGGAAADSSIFATKNWANSTFQPIGSYLTSVPTLQQVTNAGNTTTTNILKTDGFGRELVLIRESANRGQVRIFNPLESGGSNYYTTYERHGIDYMGTYNGGLTAFPDTFGVSKRFAIGVKLNGTAYWSSPGGLVDVGTISVSADSAVFATTYRVDTAKANLRSSLAAKENILTFNSPLTRSSNTIGLDTTSGKWRSENYYNTKFQPIGSYLTAADSLAMLNGRISSITLNTSGAIHTTPITFSRVGGAWSGTMSLATQTANTVFAGPTTGSAATPTFRTLVDADIPSTSKGVQWTGVDSAFAVNSALNGYHELEDFIGIGSSISNGGNVPGSKFGLANTNSGTYSATQISGTMGSVTLSTAANAAGASGIGHFAAGVQALSFEATSDWTVFQTRVKVPVLNDGTERYFLFFGFSDATGTGWYNPTALANGIGFYYDLSGSVTGSASTANFQTATASSSSRTFNQNYTGVAVPTDTWVTLTIKYTSSQVQFFINGTLRATHTTNIPTAFLTPHLVIRKTNGTTARTINVDYISIDKKFTR